MYTDLVMVQQLSELPVANLTELEGWLISFKDQCNALLLELQQLV